MKKRVVSIILFLIGAIVGAIAEIKILLNKKNKFQELSDKNFTLMSLLNQWLKTKQEGKVLTEYFKKRKIECIAIYGMSYIGERLYNELKNSDIQVKYAIDRNLDGIYAEIDIFSPEEELATVDAVVVTAVFYYDEIKAMLKEKLNCPILSLEDILYEI